MQRPWGQERVIEELGKKKAQDWNLEKRWGGRRWGLYHGTQREGHLT